MSGRSEVITLNPSEVALADRPEIDLHDGAIQVREEGIDWGQAEINAFMAKLRMGQVPVDVEWPNRVIKMPLILGAVDDFDAARLAIQAEAARINEEGGWLKRQVIGGSYGEAGKHLFADIVKADLLYSGGSEQASRGFDPGAQLVLEALPDFYGDWVHEVAFALTGAGSKTFQVRGNLPARGDLTFTDKAGLTLNGLGWFVRCRHYDPAETASWRYEAEALAKLDLATEVSLEGSSSGKAIRHDNLATAFTPVLGLQLKSGTYLTHRGLYDVIVRVYTTSGNLPWLRLLHDVGDAIAPSLNPQVQVPGSNNFYELHVGQINLREAPFGPHRWIGAIQARGLEGGENIYIDTVELVCADEGSGFLTAPRNYDVPLSGYKARDRYLQSTGNLTGKTAEVGGKNYTAITPADAVDFTVTVGKKAQRTETNDTSPEGSIYGRAVGLALGLTDQMAEIDFTWSNYGGFWVRSGLLLRATDVNNYVNIYYSTNKLETSEEGDEGVMGIKVVRGGALKFNWEKEIGPRRLAGTIKAGVIGDDFVIYLDGELIDFTDPITIFGNVPDKLSLLPAGGVYLYDACSGSTAITRQYDNLSVWVPDQDAVAFANRSARIAHQGAYRQDPTGTAYGPVAYPGSDTLRVPVSGPEERPVEIGVRGTPGDFEALADSGLGAAEAQFSYRPCWSQVPGLS